MTQHPHHPHPKIAHHHLQRRAVVYVRQSTLQQLNNHQESTRLQYGLTSRAQKLGWTDELIEVIDEDMGRSGASAVGRPGFQRMVAQVSLGQIGLILGIEMSRLARSCRDWHQLLEACALFGTLLADPEGVYDPANYNDRLLLGLKGTLSEAELHLLKQRMHEGRRAKAKRGELKIRLPMGYFRTPAGEVIQEPDEEARTVIETLFEQFQQKGSINALLLWLIRHQIRLPIREITGPNKGQLTWRRPCRQTLNNTIKHPIYAGAYVYGRHPTDPRRKQPGRLGSGRTSPPMEEWEVFLPDRLPAYISWEQYLANQKQLRNNCAKFLGSPRQGPSLLCGLLVCGRCGYRMAIQYSAGNGRYVCARHKIEYGGARCQGLSNRPVDQAVDALVLQAVEPAALELSLQVAADLDQEQARLHQLWKQKLERNQYEIERAYRQFNAVEPENRLVARIVEKKLDEKLTEQNQLQTQYQIFQTKQPLVISVSDRDAIRALATEIPTLWRDPQTTIPERMEVIRLMIERVEVTVLGETEKVSMTIQWVGGHRSQHEVIRPVRSSTQLSYYPALIDLIGTLRKSGKTAGQIAEQLNSEGWKTTKQKGAFNANMLRAMMARAGLAKRRSGASPWPTPELEENEWLLPKLSEHLKIPKGTLQHWVSQGWVQARKTTGKRGQWIISADEAEQDRLRQLRAIPTSEWLRRKDLFEHKKEENVTRSAV